jgi:hypothetical protein
MFFLPRPTNKVTDQEVRELEIFAPIDSLNILGMRSKDIPNCFKELAWDSRRKK